MSGRSLRRLPVLAHARYIGMLPASTARIPATQGTSGRSAFSSSSAITVEIWLDAMERVVQGEATERERLQK